MTVYDYSCCDTYVVVGILDDQHDGTVHPLHVAVQGLQGEAVLLGAVDQSPGVADGPRRHVLIQLVKTQRQIQDSSQYCM